MEHLVFISSNYPSKSRPYYGTFVRQLVIGIARLGVKCSVISPVSIFQRRYGKFDPEKSLDFAIQENPITILRPRYISFSSKKIFFYNTEHLTQKSFLRSVHHSLRYLDDTPTILYGHFLYPGGAAAVHLAYKLGIPSIVAVGESSFWSVEPLGYRKAIHDFRHVSGVISVSKLIKESLVNKLMIPEDYIQVFPNGVDLSLFYPRDRYEMRKKFGFPSAKTIISFVGHFDERKGPHRLLSAVSGLDEICLVLIGDGAVPLEGKNIVFKGTLEHSKIPEMLSASDFFALPTTSEGSCNAILEAIACGLPVITSKGDFNDDIVDDDVAIRINPLDIDEIRAAIIKLYNDQNLRNKMSSCAMEKIKRFDIESRSRNILKWMKEIKHKHTNQK